MPDSPLFKALMPEVEMKGEGTITSPGGRMARNELEKAQEERYQIHYKEFRDRGISAAEAEKLATQVLARETEGASAEPLKLSAAEAKRLKIEQE